MNDQMSALASVLRKCDVVSPIVSILDEAFAFSRMLHGSRSSSGIDAFYRTFVPEIGTTVHAGQVELVKRCMKADRDEEERVGACLFPGLVKVTREVRGQPVDEIQTVVRRAQIICQCALGLSERSSSGGVY